MKKRNRLLALLLCAAMVFSLLGCNSDPAPTDPPATDPPPTEPPALEAYAEALPALEAASDVTLNITTFTQTYVAGEHLSKGSEQVLVYTGLGTDSPAVSSTDSVNFDGINYMEYREICTDGMLYLDAENSYAGSVAYFSTETSAEEAAARYLPVVLLDAALYGSVTMEETKNGTQISFAEPAAAESWALPEGAELVEASGTALINAEGALTQYTYEIVYKYGPAKVTTTVTSGITLSAAPISAPANDSKYVPIADPDAVILYNEAANLMAEANIYSSTYMESTVSQAGAVMMNESVSFDLYYNNPAVDAKIVTNIYINAQGQTQSYEQEELFTNDRYTVSVDGGSPEWNNNITALDVSDYAFNMLYTATMDPLFWQDATLTDLGSTYLMEFGFSDDTCWSLAASVCESLYGDPDLLDDYASSRGINEVKGYFALDKFTHLPTAAGYSLDVYHTIDGQKCLLTYQVDQSYDIPSLSAYNTITGQYLAETKPINGATPLFYHVTGTDGQEMWLLGTIHVGDNRTAYLPQEIYDAFSASDAVALEFDSGAFEEQIENDAALQSAISAAYYYTDGSTIADHLDAELYETALQYLKACGSYNMNAEMLKPYLWSSSIEDFLLRQGYSLTSHQGVESRLEKLAQDEGKEIRSVESGLFQIQMLTGFSAELQETMLADSISYAPLEYVQETGELYELWCGGDEAALREALADDLSDLTEEELALYNEYNDAILINRNADMLKVAIDYLESDDVVFYAVGLAHLLTGNGLVDTLREAGYTVELVSYAG